MVRLELVTWVPILDIRWWESSCQRDRCRRLSSVTSSSTAGCVWKGEQQASEHMKAPDGIDPDWQCLTSMMLRCSTYDVLLPIC